VPLQPNHGAMTNDEAGDLRVACNWLAKTLTPIADNEQECRTRESAIAMRILELRDRLGGLIK
jgi:hypothetical protein